MPTYVIHDTKKKKTFEVFCSWNVLQEKLKDNPHYKKVITAPAIVGDHVVTKTDGGMKEVFSRIGDKHPGSPLADRFSSGGTNAQKKVIEVGKKHGLIKKSGGQNMSKVKL